jgi:hypothetical protein
MANQRVAKRKSRHTIHRTDHRFVKLAKAGHNAGRKLGSFVKKVFKKNTAKKQKTSHINQSSPTIQSPVEGLSKSFTMGPRGPYKPKGRYTNGTSTWESTTTNGGVSGVNSQANVTFNGVDNPMITAALGAMTTAGAWNPGITTTAKTYNCLVHHVSIETVFTNCSQVVADITLYDIVAKRDVNGSVDPAAVLNSYLAGQSGGATNSSGWPFIVPSHNKHFMDDFRIVKKTPIELSPGRSHKHWYTFPANRVYDIAKLNQSTTMRGLSIYTFAIWKGIPLDDKKDGTIGTIELAPIKLIWFSRSVACVRLLDMIPKLDYQNNNALGTADVSLYAQTDEHVIDVLNAAITTIPGGSV